MAVYLLPVLLVSAILITFVIVYVILQRNMLKESQPGFPALFMVNTEYTDASEEVQILSGSRITREVVEMLPDDDSGEPYTSDMSDDLNDESLSVNEEEDVDDFVWKCL